MRAVAAWTPRLNPKVELPKPWVAALHLAGSLQVEGGSTGRERGRTRGTPHVNMSSQHSRKHEVPLSGILAEFRSALREEIGAARRRESSSAIPLANGRRISRRADSYQYVFDIENVLNLPGDAPGDLYVPGRSPLEVTIVCVEGMAITVSVPADLGAFVPNAALRSNLTFLMRRLIERIEALSGVPNPVGERVRGALPVSEAPAGVQLSATNLNREQREAVASALGRDATFIWGPPGTGKTLTIGAIGEQLYRNGRTALLVSHTNIAVDQALWRIGSALSPAELAQGRVLRVGQPRDPRVEEKEDLLLKTHVERRAAEITMRLKELAADRMAAADSVAELSRKTDIYEWVADAEPDLIAMGRQLAECQGLEADLAQVQETEAWLETRCAEGATAAKAARQCLEQIAELETLDTHIADAERVHSVTQRRLTEARAHLANAEQALERAEQLAPLRARARDLPSLSVQAECVQRLQREFAEADGTLAEITERLALEGSLYARTTSVGWLTRRWRRLPSPEKQSEVVGNLRAAREAATARRDARKRALAQDEAVFAEVADIAEQLGRHMDVPEVPPQRRVVEEQRRSVMAHQTALRQTHTTLEAARALRSEIASQIEAFGDEYSAAPEDVLAEADADAAKLAEVRSLTEALARQCRDGRDALENLLSDRLAALREWDLTSEPLGAAEAMLSAIRRAYDRAVSEVADVELDAVRRELAVLNQRTRHLDGEIEKLDEALKKVEDAVIAEASIVATTLTQAYLRDAIQSRRFDTVILDEASMAPIPALWVAASLGDASAVVVGDFKQLPPIVLSDDDDGLARKWLGRDIFDEAGLIDPERPPPHLVKLREQYRMQREIGTIANDLFYGDLRHDPSTDSDRELAGWHRQDWGHDCPVLLVDTGPLNAWVTSVPRGRGSSRLNFLSATVCVDIAEQLLRDGRSPWSPQGGEPRRILIVCPYQPHARLLGLLLAEQGLDGEVSAGTVHSFQGTEASVVILDLVNDEPHWRVGMFDPKRDDNTERLLNVALTRARRRLLVIGDLDYIEKTANKHAFLRADFVPYLRTHHPVVSALDIVPPALAARAARAQTSVLAGGGLPDQDHLIVTQEEFYPLLLRDMAGAHDRIVIYSAFITRDRLSRLAPQLQATLERNVSVYVVTKAHSDRRRAELASYGKLEQALTDWGAVVVHKRGMHEKLAFIDDNILWSGSLNLLSFSNTQEVMERRVSKKVVEEFAGKLRLADLIGEYDAGQPKCPGCGWELAASEGRDDPFFWRCENPRCDYTRDIDQPRLVGGVVRCTSANCGGKVEFGEWGGKPAWRCVRNRRHHQKVARAHLLLPKMRAIIPTSALRELDRRYGTADAENAQLPLFRLDAE